MAPRSDKPPLTGAAQKLPFDSLSPDDFERLCLWLVEAEGYTGCEHLGQAGSDQGRDVVAWKNGRRVAFQCKRVQKFNAAHARKEIQKLLDLPTGERPHEIVFVVSQAVRADTRTVARTAWGDEASCNFWAGTELDKKVKDHPRVLKEFFQLPPGWGRPAAIPHNLPYSTLGPNFQGRDEMLERLHETLERSPAGRATAIAGKAVHGLGGVGKTRLAVEYAWKHAEEYSALLFVGAGSPADLRRNLAALSGSLILDLPEQEATEEEVREIAVLKWLREHSGWLLILDNVDTAGAAAAVDALIPLLHGGHMLLTGRFARWSAEVEPIELDVLTSEAAVRFLLSRTKGRRRGTKDDERLASELAGELGCLPLALEQASAYIAERRLTLAGYLDEWKSRHDQVLTWFDPKVSHYPASVAVTWQTSFDRLSTSAKRLLERLAWLSPEPIPETLLDVPIPDLKEPDADPRADLAQLEIYSLVTRAADFPTFTVHRLVQDVTRRSLRVHSPQESLFEALRWVNAAFVGDPQDVRTWPTLDPLAPHTRAVITFADAAGITDPTAWLMNHLGQLFDAKALLAEAEPLMRRALDIDEQSFGARHPNVAIRLNNLASLLQDTNRIAEAEPLMRRALDIDEQILGTRHPNVAIRLNNLAQLLKATNRLAEAEPLMWRVVTAFESSLGEHHPNVATALNNLAVLLQDTNRLVEAEPLMRRALDIDEQSFGERHPNVARDLNNLAQLLQATNRLVEAEPLMQRAFDIDEQSFGATHPNVARDLNNLAQLLKATNRLAEAEPLMRRALSIDEQSFGERHPNVAIRLNNLALLHKDTNRLGEAEPLMRRALDIDEQSFGASHPNVAKGLNNLALLLKDTNRLGEAEPLMRRALDIDEQSFGASHSNVAIRLNNLAQLLKDTNRLGEAEPLMRRALDIDEQSFGAIHPKVAIRLNNLAQLLQATNRLTEAEPLMRRHLIIFLDFSRSNGHEHPLLQAAFGNYYSLLQAMGKSDAEIEAVMEEVRLGGET